MRRRVIAALFTTALGVTACAYYDDYAHASRFGDYRYAGRVYAEGVHGGPAHFTGTGAGMLDPWLSRTMEGRAVVAMGFDTDRDGRISGDTANRANIWFRRYADHDHDLRLTDEEIRIALVQASRAG